MTHPILQLEHLVTEILLPSGDVIRPVDDVSFSLHRKETVCLVGESGCGKSMTALTIMRLLPAPAGRIAGGKILLDGVDVLTLSERQMRKVRGSRIAMIFQEPMTALNPVRTIGSQMREMFVLHQPELSNLSVHQRMQELLAWVGLSDPKDRLLEYPHQLSGGMRQRVMIAMALSCNPDVLIADEPTTALDVTIQAQILELLGRIQEEFNMAVLLITHDFGVVSEVADRVEIMYAGHIVESGTVEDIFTHTEHPYTYGLLRSIPDPTLQMDRLYTIPGVVPDLRTLPIGCRFASRCVFCIPACTAAPPPLLADRGKSHPAACIRPHIWETETPSRHPEADGRRIPS